MVVDDLDVNRVRFIPTKADPPLIVYANTVLTKPVTSENLQPISWNSCKVGKSCCRMDVIELSFRHNSNALEPRA